MSITIQERREMIRALEIERQEAERERGKAKARLEIAKRQLKKAEEKEEQARIAEEKRRDRADYRKAKSLSKRYSIEIDTDHSYWGDEIDKKWWVSKPSWLEGDDPLGDGHYAHDWATCLWIVEFYAKHHPDHPEHDKREVLDIRPGC